jgi:hypothetical protein
MGSTSIASKGLSAAHRTGADACDASYDVATKSALNLPALSDVAAVVSDLVANTQPALADTIHEVALREFLAHLITVTAPNQPLQAAATLIIRQAVLSVCEARGDE